MKALVFSLFCLFFAMPAEADCNPKILIGHPVFSLKSPLIAADLKSLAYAPTLYHLGPLVASPPKPHDSFYQDQQERYAKWILETHHQQLVLIDQIEGYGFPAFNGVIFNPEQAEANYIFKRSSRFDFYGDFKRASEQIAKAYAREDGWTGPSNRSFAGDQWRRKTWEIFGVQMGRASRKTRIVVSLGYDDLEDGLREIKIEQIRQRMRAAGGSIESVVILEQRRLTEVTADRVQVMEAY